MSARKDIAKHRSLKHLSKQRREKMDQSLLSVRYVVMGMMQMIVVSSMVRLWKKEAKD